MKVGMGVNSWYEKRVVEGALLYLRLHSKCIEYRHEPATLKAGLKTGLKNRQGVDRAICLRVGFLSVGKHAHCCGWFGRFVYL